MKWVVYECALNVYSTLLPLYDILYMLLYFWADWLTVSLSLDVLDDEVAESVYRDRGQSLDMDAVTELTADTFHSAVAESDYTVVLFYVKCEHVGFISFSIRF